MILDLAPTAFIGSSTDLFTVLKAGAAVVADLALSSAPGLGLSGALGSGLTCPTGLGAGLAAGLAIGLAAAGLAFSGFLTAAGAGLAAGLGSGLAILAGGGFVADAGLVATGFCLTATGREKKILN